jgi:hypothetical protein
MPNDSILAPAELPQMTNDGYIAETELQSDGGIIVNDSRYSSAEKRDCLACIWSPPSLVYVYPVSQFRTEFSALYCKNQHDG